MDYQADSVSVFKPFWLSFRLLGVYAYQKKDFTIAYDIFMNVFIYIWYPVHLTIGLMSLSTQGEMVMNMSITLTTIVCTLKHYCLRFKLKQIDEMMDLFAKLDGRIIAQEERKYYTSSSVKYAKLLAKMFFSVYMGANVAALVSVILASERRLMYPAWFPFDWHSSLLLFIAALLYQFTGITILIIMNFSNDALAPVALCLFSGQVHVLGMRVAKLGHDTKKSMQQHENELKKCVEDHLNLLKLYTTTEDCLSYSQLLLFISSSLNICIVIVYLYFFVDNLFSYIYYVFFLSAIAVELFPIYYYGTILQEEFNNLTYAIFSSNWPSQTRSFRLSVLIFGEVTLRKLTMLAGGIVGLRLETFFAICKTAYSLFAVAIRFK